jgi:hypothetical protein
VCRAQQASGAIHVDWAKYGKYELVPFSGASQQYEGAVVGKPSSWRRMAFLRPFSPEEAALIQSGQYGDAFVSFFIIEMLNR